MTSLDDIPAIKLEQLRERLQQAEADLERMRGTPAYLFQFEKTRNLRSLVRDEAERQERIRGRS